MSRIVSELLLTKERKMQNHECNGKETAQEVDVEESSITLERIKLAVKEMKNGKSPGYDRILAELLTGNQDI